MRRKLSNQFLANYLIVFLLSVVAAFFAFLLLSAADRIISSALVKNRYPARSIMQDDYRQIDAAPVIDNGGGVQVIDRAYRVVYSGGVDTINKSQLSAAEFTNFLVQSKSKGIPYHYDIAYSPRGEFWLIITFPTSIRLDFSIVYNKDAISRDFNQVFGVILGILLFYLLTLALFSYPYSRITAAGITRPLRKLCDGTRLLREGDYSVRVDLRLKNEFAELQDTFNDMAARIEREMSLRQQSEEERRRLILDISHDLKNPLSSVLGYAELCMKKLELPEQERNGYLRVIYNNSQRASRLLSQLFEISKLDSPSFSLKPMKTDLCEYLRQNCGELLPLLERAGFGYEFNIPEKNVYSMLDTDQFGRVFQNLADNAIRYNPNGTFIMVSLSQEANQAIILFSDAGIGIPAQIAGDIFKPFVRSDDSRNSETGGSGLGLSIAQKIVEAHGGSLTLRPDLDRGCTFAITLPVI